MLQTMLEGVSFLPVGRVGFVFTFSLALKLPMVVVHQQGNWMWCQVDLRGLRRFDSQVFPTPRFKRHQTFADFIEWQDLWYILLSLCPFRRCLLYIAAIFARCQPSWCKGAVVLLRRPCHAFATWLHTCMKRMLSCLDKRGRLAI